jgi:hypothetical protein
MRDVSTDIFSTEEYSTFSKLGFVIYFGQAIKENLVVETTVLATVAPEYRC